MRVRCCWTKWSAGARCMWLAGVAVEFDHVLAGLLPAGSDGEVLASPTMIVESFLLTVPAVSAPHGVMLSC